MSKINLTVYLRLKAIIILLIMVWRGSMLRINPKKTYSSPIAMKLKIKLHSTSRIPFSLKKVFVIFELWSRGLGEPFWSS